ncbi:MAG: DUF1559 domain-containing protein [Planctomycetales bacterium]|nr:DUF1559 domain-containing protein [Planctomycetales bacterium]
MKRRIYHLLDPHPAPLPKGEGDRRGMTLVEVLVVISIIGILVALLLPAIQYAREASRRMACGSNLRQLGNGIHLHHGARRILPESISPFWEGTAPIPRRDGSGWILRTLPYIEQNSLLNQFSPSLGSDFLSGQGLRSPACLPPMQTMLPILLCGSDDSGRGLSDQQYQWVGTRVALTNYKGVIGDNRMGGTQSMFTGTEPDCISTGKCNGLFYRLTYQSPLGLGSIKDGLSNTLMVGEDVPGENNHSTAYYANGDYASCHAPLNYFPKPSRPNDWWDVMSFRSHHPCGANFCMADGSVHFVSQQINHKLYRALSTRNGNEAGSLP